MSWSLRLIQPVVPKGGKPIVTLSDARAYILNLPEADLQLSHVQDGGRVLVLAAERRVCMFVAQSAVAHIVHGPPKHLNRGKRDRPWMKRKPTS